MIQMDYDIGSVILVLAKKMKEQWPHNFLASAEFKELYGEDVSNQSYVNTLYLNVLGRGADESGLIYWLGRLNTG